MAGNYKKQRVSITKSETSTIPEEILTNKKLRKLNISNCNIKKIPAAITQLHRLETLNLSGNQIKNLYAKVCELSSLKILIVDNNQITTLPKQVGKLTNLKILSLSNNSLTELPKEIDNLQNIEEFNISNNNIRNFPSVIFSLKKLKCLWIAQNDFNDFPIEKIISDLPNLKSLYCYSYNLDTNRTNYDPRYVEASKIKGNCLPYFKNKLDRPLVSNKNTIEVIQKQNIAPNKNKIFISYAHKDKNPWLDKLLTHLKVLSLEGLNLEVWDDTKIKIGTKWRDEIKQNLDDAYIAILLVSTHFLASEFVRTNELPPLLLSASENGTKILPVIVSPCRFLKTDTLKDFQAVNDPNNPLADVDSSTQDRIFLKLMDEIEEYINSMK